MNKNCDYYKGVADGMERGYALGIAEAKKDQPDLIEVYKAAFNDAMNKMKRCRD